MAAPVTSDATAKTATAARKKRIQQRRKQREEESDAESVVSSKRPRTMGHSSYDEDGSQSDGDSTSDLKPHPTGIKKQSRYHPGVPMTREELRGWRKEARRVRNRESAAASRKKNRERITELEEEKEVIHSKYKLALRRIMELEAAASSSSTSSSFTPASLRQDIANMYDSNSSDDKDEELDRYSLRRRYHQQPHQSAYNGNDQSTYSLSPISDSLSGTPCIASHALLGPTNLTQNLPAAKITGADKRELMFLPTDDVPVGFDLDGTAEDAANADDMAAAAEATAVSEASTSDTASDIDESELGEFLLEALDGYDNTSMLEGIDDNPIFAI